VKPIFSFIISVLILSTVKGQTYTTIKGIVYQKISYEIDSLAIQNANIILEINDTLKIMTLTDLDGKYEFHIKPFKGVIKLYTYITKDTKTKGKKNTCIFQSRDTKMIKLDPSKEVIYYANFEFREGCCLPYIPTVYFKENSLEINTDSLVLRHESKEFMKFLSDLLSDNPTMVLEIMGNCDRKEKNKEELSLKRAEVIQKMLCDAGFEKARIKIGGKGDKLPASFFNEPKPNKVLQQQRNRRIDIRILSFDYGPKARKSSGADNDDGEE
jgi:outer membrane protein OmpA-like peptidoglycan-associated protein